MQADREPSEPSKCRSPTRKVGKTASQCRQVQDL